MGSDKRKGQNPYFSMNFGLSESLLDYQMVAGSFECKEYCSVFYVNLFKTVMILPPILPKRAERRIVQFGSHLGRAFCSRMVIFISICASCKMLYKTVSFFI